jgi:CYTH domain-containing protein
LIEKIRFIICAFDNKWEIDEFLGENSGLIVAEVELKEEDQLIKLPDWLGDEVSHEPKYFNSNLATNPYKNWEK